MHHTIIISGYSNPGQSYANKTILKYFEGMNVPELVITHGTQRRWAGRKLKAICK